MAKAKKNRVNFIKSDQQKEHTNMHVFFLLDRSGSMGSCVPATLDAYNEYMNSLRIDEPKARVSLVLFDTDYHRTSSIETVYSNKKASAVPTLTRNVYQPRGGTPLYDAIGFTMGKIRAVAEPGDRDWETVSIDEVL